MIVNFDFGVSLLLSPNFAQVVIVFLSHCGIPGVFSPESADMKRGTGPVSFLSGFWMNEVNHLGFMVLLSVTSVPNARNFFFNC